SDFDGVPELPVGMEDVSDLGALRAALEARDLPIRPIFGGNVLRVLAAAGPGDADADRGAPEE
ncbi:MAG TPA: membrane dipeptidase, partial [Polyangiaceae bacterium LLY-WYZ-15_(1-7)]|nr:membrane dipeptidase [Polyangiaceae bacterium LLY-WYZ-15_(1-7)]